MARTRTTTSTTANTATKQQTPARTRGTGGGPGFRGTPAQPNPAQPNPARRRSLAVAGAVGAAVVLWIVGFALLGLAPVVGAGDQEQQVTLASAAVVPLLAGAAAWGLLALLERRTARALRIWRITGWTFLAVSLLGPLGLALAPGTLAVLVAMHVAVGTILMLGLPVPHAASAAYSGKNPSEDPS